MKFGLYKSKLDTRDILMHSFLKDITLPNKFTRRAEMPPVLNQGNEGSCAGHSATMMKEYQEQKDHKKFIRLSPRFVYELAKKKSGHSEGTTLRAIVDTLKNEGICEEEYWEYVPGKPGEYKSNAYKNALKYTISAYARILNLKELKQAIYQDYPNGGAVMIGVKVYKGMVGESSKKTGVVPNPGCLERMNSLGGHAITACGWNDNSTYFKNDGHILAEGSWGKDFGDNGYHYLSYSYIKNNMLDAMSTIDIDTPDIDIIRLQDLTRYHEDELWI